MKRENIYLLLLSVALFFLWDAKCSGNGTIKATKKEVGTEITIPEAKGVLNSKGVIESKPIVANPKNSNSLIKANSPQLESESKKDSINSLLIQEQTARIEAYKQLDSIKKIQFVSNILQPKDFFHTLEDSIVKIDFKAKGFGELKNIELSYTRKEIKATLKQYLLLGGVEIGSNQLLNEFKAKGNLMYLSPRKTLYSLSVDNDKIIYFGVGKKIFEINKVN